MGQLVLLEKKKRERVTAMPMPEDWSPKEKLEILLWARGKNFTIEELIFAIESVRDWWERRHQERHNWKAVLKNGMRTGWALRGFREEMLRKGWATRGQHGHIHVNRRTQITEERISMWREKVRDGF